MASSALFTPAATPTDVFQMLGAANVIARIYKIWLTSLQTTAGINNWYLIKRSAANTGGSPVSLTNVPLDSNDAAAQAALKTFAANPSALGTAVGTILTRRLLAPAAASVAELTQELIFDAGNQNHGKPIVLRSAAEALCLNFAGAALPSGLSIGVSVLWREDPLSSYNAY
jgi:hypothetical protein